jgi:PAS domain S-box-containing protein
MVESFLPLIEALTATRSDDAGQALVDSISDLAWIKDGESRFVAVNQALARAVGHTREEILGKTDHAYFPIEIADEYVRGDREVFQGGVPYRSVDPIPDGAGGMRWIETIKSPVRDRSGAIVGTAGVARDITSRQELEDERTRLVDELAREHDRLTDTIANVPGVVWEEMFDNSYRFVSDQIEFIRPVVAHLRQGLFRPDVCLRIEPTPAGSPQFWHPALALFLCHRHWARLIRGFQDDTAGMEAGCFLPAVVSHQRLLLYQLPGY